MKNAKACLDQNEAIGPSCQDYQKSGYVAAESCVLKMGLVAFNGISASFDSRTKFLWQIEPSHKPCLMFSLKPGTYKT